MTEKNIVDIYDRTHNLSSPEHAAAFAARIHQSEDVKNKDLWHASANCHKHS